jgi:hypothetical protein
MKKLVRDFVSSVAMTFALAAALMFAMPAAALNTAGDAVFASASISDGTGVVTTVATATTYVTVGTAAPLASGLADGSGCITYTLASNSFTVAKRCGVGNLLLKACGYDVIGVNTRTYLGAWHRVRAGVTTVASPVVRQVEAAAAVRQPFGCVEMLVDANLNDTYDFRYDSSTNGDTVTTRAAYFEVRKILNK